MSQWVMSLMTHNSHPDVLTHLTHDDPLTPRPTVSSHAANREY